ncbi:MAG: hypothetical protein AAF847_15335, partial [Bacteroidota bacterium]
LITTIIFPLVLCLLCSLKAKSQSLVVNETNKVYEFKYNFKAKKTAKLQRILTRKLGTPTKLKMGKKIVWKTDKTKVKLKRGTLKLKHKGDNTLKWKLLKTRISLT